MCCFMVYDSQFSLNMNKEKNSCTFAYFILGSSPAYTTAMPNFTILRRMYSFTIPKKSNERISCLGWFRSLKNYK